MSRGKGNCKGTRNDDLVECTCCKQRITRKEIPNHYIVYEFGKKGYGKHPRTTTHRINELENPKDYNSAILQTKSINNFFTPIKQKKKNQC